MQEKDIEKKMCADLAKYGCLTRKFVSPGNSGMPDRIVITARGSVIFVEIKTDFGRLSPLQKSQIEQLRKNKTHVRVLKGQKDVDAFVEEIAQDWMGCEKHDSL
jgi:hypothetical protein